MESKSGLTMALGAAPESITLAIALLGSFGLTLGVTVTAGRHTLISRAINADGEVQPTQQELREKLASQREDHSQWPRVLTIEPL